MGLKRLASVLRRGSPMGDVKTDQGKRLNDSVILSHSTPSS